MALSTQVDELAGRVYARIYRARGRLDLHTLIKDAIVRSGGRVVSESPHTRVPFFFGVQTTVGERLGLLIYPVRLTNVSTKNRPEGEHHAQVKFGNAAQWRSEVHPIAFDVAGVDTTLFLGINAAERRFVGLDPALWNPMPLGVSFYASDGDFVEMGGEGWYAWEVDTRDGERNEARTPEGFESRVAFTPERFLDFARFERRASDLGLDTALRVKLGQQFRDRGFADRASRSTHPLEEQFGLDATTILDLIAERRMLTTAVKGGVAEAHLEAQLRVHPSIARISRRTDDRSADFDVQLNDGRAFVIECKNVSPNRLADGTVQVETQRTRNSKNDSTARLYGVGSFDVVAACLFSVTGRWTFKFVRTSKLTEHPSHAGFLATKQRVDDRWCDSIEDLDH